MTDKPDFICTCCNNTALSEYVKEVDGVVAEVRKEANDRIDDYTDTITELEAALTVIIAVSLYGDPDSKILPTARLALHRKSNIFDTARNEALEELKTRLHPTQHDYTVRGWYEHLVATIDALKTDREGE